MKVHHAREGNATKERKTRSSDAFGHAVGAPSNGQLLSSCLPKASVPDCVVAQKWKCFSSQQREVFVPDDN